MLLVKVEKNYEKDRKEDNIIKVAKCLWGTRNKIQNGESNFKSFRNYKFLIYRNIFSCIQIRH